MKKKNDICQRRIYSAIEVLGGHLRDSRDLRKIRRLKNDQTEAEADAEYLLDEVGRELDITYLQPLPAGLHDIQQVFRVVGDLFVRHREANMDVLLALESRLCEMSSP